VSVVQSDYYRFTPQPDITVYELALILQYILKGMNAQISIPPDAREWPMYWNTGMIRHFTVIA
jgi:hypothetical protein